jgi:serine/threonine protein kinase
LKPKNILALGTNYKIADFGLARVYSKIEITGGVGSFIYMPPEAENGGD